MKKAVLSLLMVICFVAFSNAQQKEGVKKETSTEVKVCKADCKKACCADKKEGTKKECATEPKKACCAGSKK